MNTKLTLHVDKDIIEQAKRYAQDKQQSLSALVEDYFRYLFRREEHSPVSPGISPTVQELSGIIHLDATGDVREDYTDHLLEKYR